MSRRRSADRLRGWHTRSAAARLADTIFTTVKGPYLRAFLASVAVALAVPALAVASSSSKPRVLADRLPDGGQSGHGELPRPPARPGLEQGLQRGRDPARHARRPLGLDADDRQARARLEDPGDRLRLAAGLARRLGRGLDHGGRGCRGHGAADQHRLVHADRQQRPEPRLRPQAQGDQRRGRLAREPDALPPPQRCVGREGRPRSRERATTRPRRRSTSWTCWRRRCRLF